MKNELVDFLVAIKSRNMEFEPDIEILDKNLKSAILQFGSETPDNIACCENLKYEKLIDSHTPVYLKDIVTSSSEVSIRKILYQLESDEPMKELELILKEITLDEWNAIMRLVTLLLSGTKIRTLELTPENTSMDEEAYQRLAQHIRKYG